MKVSKVEAIHPISRHLQRKTRTNCSLDLAGKSKELNEVWKHNLTMESIGFLHAIREKIN